MKSLNKVWELLSARNRKRSILIIFVGIVTVFLEMAGIGIIIPIVSLLLSENYIQKFPNLTSFLQNYFTVNKYNLIVFVLSLLAIIFILKGSLLTLFSLFKFEFSNILRKDFSKKLMHNYLNKSYIFFLNKNSAEYLRDIDATHAISRVWICFLQLIVDILMFLFAMGLLFIINLKISLLVLIVVLPTGALYYLYVKKKLKILGSEMLFFQAKQQKSLLESFGGIKMIKLANYETFFINLYDRFLGLFLQNEKLSKLINIFPRYLLEIISAISMCLIIIFMMSSGKNQTEIITLLAVFGYAGFKIMPTITRSMENLQQIKHASASVKLILGNLKIENNQELFKNFSNEKKIINSISLKNISFSYPNTQKKILDKVNIELKKNKIIGIIGPSGAGKSTLLDLILGFLNPTIGSITLNDNQQNFSLNKFQKNCGYVSQNTYLLDESIKNNIIFGEKDPYSKGNSEKIDNVVKFSNLNELISDLPNGLDTIVGERGAKLSIGQIQRVGLARALFRDPEVLILDEFTSALDEITEKKILNNLNELKKDKIIVISSHKKEPLKFCDAIFRIEKTNLKYINQDFKTHDK